MLFNFPRHVFIYVFAYGICNYEHWCLLVFQWSTFKYYLNQLLFGGYKDLMINSLEEKRTCSSHILDSKHSIQQYCKRVHIDLVFPKHLSKNRVFHWYYAGFLIIGGHPCSHDFFWTPLSKPMSPPMGHPPSP